MNRYEKQMALPEITPEKQARLARTKLLMIGAGGLGAAALPYLAGAGIGHMTIIDHDAVDISNLHRQTIFKEEDEDQNKALSAAAYLKELNSSIEIVALQKKLTSQNAAEISQGFDLLLDGSDNFETKTLLNEISFQTQTPLISASVEGFMGIAGIFAGYEKNAPCYHCLYPALPLNACNCNDAGILGTAAGLAGMYQAHLTLCYLLNIGEAKAGTILSFDFKNFRMNNLKLPKNEYCEYCKKGRMKMAAPANDEIHEIPLTHPSEITDHLIVDVRTHEEVANDPIENALHMPLDTVPARFEELPKDRPLAFACASNIRSRKAAEYLKARGFDNVCVLDRLAG